MALKGKTIPQHGSPDEHIAEAIEAGLTDGKLPCPAAFAISKDLGVTPREVGNTANLMNVHLSRCQLGFFGYPAKQGYTATGVPDLDVPEGLPEAIQAAQNKAGNVSCADLWILAATYAAPRLLVGYVTDQLGIHVTPCRLGAF